MSVNIADTAIVYPNVILGKNVIIEDFCIVGIPGGNEESSPTIISDGTVLRSGTYVYAGTSIGKNFTSGNKVNIRERCSIGDGVSLGTLTVVEHSVTIRDDVRVHSQVFIPEFTILEKNSWIGPNVVFTNALYPNQPNTKNELKGCRVKENAKIGANSTILPGVIIGASSLIGAGSVVTSSVATNSIMAGNPAKFLRKNWY